MVLYTLYFGWAFLVILYLLIDRVFGGMETLKHSVYAIAILLIAIFSFPGMYSLVNFGVTYYPI